MAANKHRALVAGALVFAAAAVPAFAALRSAESTGTPVGQCRAAFGSLNGGLCLDGPADSPDGSAGIPSVGIGPTQGGNGPGISTSPLFPGQSINVPLGP
jgi:hypothetical protein